MSLILLKYYINYSYMNAAPRSLNICKVCVKKAVDKGVECNDLCKDWYHPECVKFSASQYKMTADVLVKTGSCDRVNCTTAQTDNHSNLLCQILQR